MQKEKFGFVYIWRDRKHNRFYIGCHWGHPDDGYICSSTWMRNAYRRRPEDFKRRILIRIYTTRRHLLIEEQKWLDLIKNSELTKRYYNHRKQVLNDPWWSNPDSRKTIGERISQSCLGRKLSEEHKQKLRVARTGANNMWFGTHGPMGGNIHSQETRQIMSESHKGYKRTVEHQRKLTKTQIGRKKTPETCRRISEAKMGHPSWNKGKKLSDEHRRKLSEAHQRRFAKSA